MSRTSEVPVGRTRVTQTQPARRSWTRGGNIDVMNCPSKWPGATAHAQASLQVEAASSSLEREAETLAGMVVRDSFTNATKEAASDGSERPSMRRYHDMQRSGPGDAVTIANRNVTDISHSSVEVNETGLRLLRAEGGHPLPLRVRRPAEVALGYDFSRVQVHTSPRAFALARSISAEAFTIGKDVVFARDRYHPDTPSGMHLLAHELVHTAQQGAAIEGKSPTRVTRSDRQRPAARRAQGTSSKSTELERIIAELATIHPVLATLKDTAEVVAYVIEKVASGQWGNERDGRIGKLLAAANQSTETYSRTFDKDAYTAKEGPRVFQQWKLENAGKSSVTFFPDIDPAVDPPLSKQDADLQIVANDRLAGKWTDMVEGARTFDELMEKMRSMREVAKRRNPTFAASGSWREVVLTGHGVTEKESSGKMDAGWQLGTEWADTEVLASYPSDHTDGSLAPGATIDLQGCDIKDIDPEKKFRWELGRIFFGEGSWGYIKAYGTVTGQHAGITRTSLKGPDPEVLVWPNDFPQHQQRKQSTAEKASDATND